MSSHARLDELKRELAALRGGVSARLTDGDDARDREAANPAEIPLRG